MKRNLTLLLPLLLPMFVSASSPVNPPQGLQIQNTFQQPSDLLKLLNTLADWFFTILLVMGVIFILIAGFHYLSGSGSEEKVKKAHKMLLYAVIAIAVGLLSQGIVFIIRSLVH